MAKVWFFTKMYEHYNSKSLVKSRVLWVYGVGFTKTLGGDRSIQLSYTHKRYVSDYNTVFIFNQVYRLHNLKILRDFRFYYFSILLGFFKKII